MALTLFSVSSALACNGSHVIGAGTSGAVYTISADTMKEGGLYLGLNVETIQNKTLSDAKILEAMDAGSEHLHQVGSVNTYSLAVSYGISDNLTLNMQLPFTSRKDIRAGEDDGGGPEIHPHDDVNEVGDISAILQYKVYDKSDIKIALLLGIKTPTGVDDAKEGDEVLEADLQSGSGSWDIFTGIAFSKEFEIFSLHSDILYKYNNTGVNSSQLGDIFTYNVALSHRLIGANHNHLLSETKTHYKLDIFAELNGEWADSDKFSGIKAENTGHDVVFATVGLQVSIEDNYSLFFSVSKPIYQDFNGVQNEISYKASAGIGMSF